MKQQSNENIANLNKEWNKQWKTTSTGTKHGELKKSNINKRCLKSEKQCKHNNATDWKSQFESI